MFPLLPLPAKVSLCTIEKEGSTKGGKGMIKSKKSMSCTNWLVHLTAHHKGTLMKEGCCKVLFSLWKKPSSGTLLSPL